MPRRSRRQPTLGDRIAEVAGSLSPAQSRVAHLLGDAPDVVAFGTVAEVAAAASTSPQTVLRLAGRLGHPGFPGLQDEVRAELIARLPPAADRIRRPPGPDVAGEVRRADERNVIRSLDVDPEDLASVVHLLADAERRIAVVAADSWTGVAELFAGHLGHLRDDVVVIGGPEPRVVRDVSFLSATDVVVALDVRRYERWVLAAAEQASARGATIVAVTDGPTAPLAGLARHRFVAAVDSPGPFESATGVVALLHLLVTAVATEVRSTAQRRLDAVESAWAERGTLLDP